VYVPDGVLLDIKDLQNTIDGQIIETVIIVFFKRSISAKGQLGVADNIQGTAEDVPLHQILNKNVRLAVMIDVLANLNFQISNFAHRSLRVLDWGRFYQKV
jgi:hypothetical protein